MEFFEISLGNDMAAVSRLTLSKSKINKENKPVQSDTLKPVGGPGAYGQPCAESQKKGFNPICAD